MGPDAQNQLDVGVGALAGSTIMLITVPWLLSVYAGRVDIEDGKAKYTKAGKRAEGAVTGVPNSPAVQKGGYVMMLTAVSYIILQGPAQYFESEGDNLEEVAAGEKMFALVGLVFTLFLFFAYLYYQWKLSLSDDDEVTEKIHVEMVIKQIEAGNVTLRGALYYELLQFGATIKGGSSYSAINASAPDVWAKLTPNAQHLFKSIIKKFWRKFVKKSDGSVKTVELGKLFVSMGENVKPTEIEAIFKQFDVDGNGEVDFSEFCMGTTQYLWDNKNRADLTSESEKFQATIARSQEDGEEAEDDEEEEMPDDLAGLAPEEQQRRLLQMSLTTMGLGTFLVVLFSDPMTGWLSTVVLPVLITLLAV
jgi:hypothetical protein